MHYHNRLLIQFLLLLVGSFVVEKVCAKPLQEDSILVWLNYYIDEESAYSDIYLREYHLNGTILQEFPLTGYVRRIY
jgi:hypothetical protein